MAAQQDPSETADAEHAALIAHACRRAETLLEQLIAEQAAVDRTPPDISAAVLAEGRSAIRQAIAATPRTLKALAAAAQAAKVGDASH